MTTIIVISVAVFLATFLGGLFAMKFKDKLHLILGFSAGAVLGIALFDLVPEAFEIVGGNAKIFIALGVITYMVLDRLVGHSHGDGHEHTHENKERGVLRASSLSVHSLIDGLAIGFSFNVSPTLGAIVAAAVLAHDFSDGINTVSAIMKAGLARRSAMNWLALDAIAPVAGIIVGTLLPISEIYLGYLIAIFAGFFIYIGLADLVPESYHNHPKYWTTVLTILGVLFVAVVTTIAG